MERTLVSVLLTLCMLSVSPVLAVGNIQMEQDNLLMWNAGTSVSPEAVAAYGIDRCFSAEQIPDKVWKRMQGKSYVSNPHIGRKDLRYLRILHWDYDNKVHIGEMVCNKLIANVLIDIFRELYNHRYPIQRMVLPDNYNADDELQMRDNNTSCFCYRVVSGSKSLSKHSMGLAVDLNTLYNPYYKNKPGKQRFVQPSTAAEYCDRTQIFRYKIDENDLAYKLFTRKGFRWGGSWRSCKDFQHFEYVIQNKPKRR